MNDSIQKYLHQLRMPQPDSHKGQNGKLLLIGGSNLFHAASKWSLDVASKFVDMVFYSSVPSNNDLIQAAKKEFWNGIVVERSEVENYLREADCILIGPGMERTEETENLVNHLLEKYSHKKWVIDAGALQMVNPTLLNERCVITPHLEEFKRVYRKISDTAEVGLERETLLHFSQSLNGTTVLLKGQKDLVFQYRENASQYEEVEGGNAGMTKGGTGDALAGLVAGLYCQNDIFTSAVVASFINKKAGDALYQKVGPNFNASDLVQEIPQTLWSEIQKNK